MTLFKILVLLTICQIIKSLGEVFDKPQQNQLQIIKVTQLFYFNLNNTVTLTYNTPKLRQPNALITYDTIVSNHFSSSSPEVVSWFNIRSENITLSSLDIYIEAADQQTNPGFQYLSFSVMISCVDTRYFQIVNWQYTGPRMIANQVNFFNVTINPLPDPFAYCFSDTAQTVRQKINFMLTLNGFTGCNWLSLSRDVSFHLSRLNFHIYNSNVTTFTIALYSDHRTWVDKYWLGFLFICPNSYLLKNKYVAQFKYIGIGSQLTCEPFTKYQSQFLTMSNTYPYLEFIGTRFIIPNLNKTSGWTFVYQFSLDGSQNASRRYYQAWQMCGMIDYNVLFIVQKYCSGNRTYIQSNGSCVCDNSLNFYETGVINCEFICPSPLINLNFQCKTCTQIYGIGCIACNNLTCNFCDTNFDLVNNSCQCMNDRAIFNTNQCHLCNTVYGKYCQSCDNISCLSCSLNFVLNNNNSTCQCIQGRLQFMDKCFLCEQFYGKGCKSCDQFSCKECEANWTLKSNGTCVCQSPNYIQVVTSKCIQYNNNTSVSSNTTTNETFTISQTHAQLGPYLYVFLELNKPFHQITQVIPLQSNIVIRQGDIQIPSIKWISVQNNKLSLQIQLNQLQRQTNGDINNANLSIQIVNPRYLKWKQLSIQNQLQPITVQPFLSPSSLYISLLQYLCTIVQYIYPFVVLASWGVFNNGFQLWFLFASYLYLKPTIYGHTQSALVQINKSQFLTFFKIDQFIQGIQINHQNVSFIQIAMEKNKSIMELTLSIILVYLGSIIMCLSFRYYVNKKKPMNKIYVIYNNFIQHYKEYMFTNFLAIFSFMALPICVQFQQLFNSNWDLGMQSMFVNLMVTAVLVITILIVPFIGLCMFPLKNNTNNQNLQIATISQRNTYSVAYNKLYPVGVSIIIQNFMRMFRTAIFVIVIFLLREYDPFIGQLALIAYNLTYLLVVIINYKKYMAKLYWAFCMVKNLLFIAFQLGFLFLPIDFKIDEYKQQTSIFNNDSACLWLIILLILFEIIELFIKAIRMFIANKYDWKQVSLKSNKILPAEIQEIISNQQPKSTKSLAKK